MRAAKVDRNQKEIVAHARNMGSTVAITSNVHKGFPDIIVGYQSKNFLIEIKDGEQPPSKRKLTPDQEVFHSHWEGSIHVIKNVDELEELLNS